MTDDPNKSQDGNNNDPNKTSAGEPGTKQSDTFSREYVHELREENKSWRLQLQEANKKIDDLTNKIDGTNKETLEAKGQEIERLQTLVKDLEGRIQSQEIDFALKAKAKEMGLKDLDALQMIPAKEKDLLELKNGSIINLEQVLSAFKESKPYLFGENGNNDDGSKKAPGVNNQAPGKSSAGKPLFTRSQIAAMDTKEYSENRDKILEAQSKGLISNE